MMKRSDFRFLDRLRVRWAEVDMQRIVFNGHYLMYFDTAVAAYWRAMAMPYQETMEHLGGDLFVRKATLEYLSSARYDDLLEVGIRCSRIGTSSMLLQAGVFRAERCLVHGELVYVFADPATQSSRPVPAALRDALEAFEAGEPMVTLQFGTWRDVGEAAARVRELVFLEEQRIPTEVVFDALDADALHGVVLNRFGHVVASGRLVALAPGVAQIGRVAVVQAVRASRVGRGLLDALVAAAAARGDREVMLHAQTSASAFYARAGFVERGPVFEEAGIPHVEMIRPLAASSPA